MNEKQAALIAKAKELHKAIAEETANIQAQFASLQAAQKNLVAIKNQLAEIHAEGEAEGLTVDDLNPDVE